VFLSVARLCLENLEMLVDLKRINSELKAAEGLARTAPARALAHLDEALDLWSKRPAADRDPVHRDRIARMWIESEVLRYTNQRAAAKAARRSQSCSCGRCQDQSSTNVCIQRFR